MEQIPQFSLEPEFQHVLIDEYQDLNPCDLAIAEAIATRGAALLACGDDDQSIYGFRFADPSGIRKFTSQFRGAADLALTECWRCGPRILEAALWVAQQDARRVEKSLHSAGNQPPGEVHLLSFRNGPAEAQGIAKLCRKYIDAGVAPDQVLILVRSDHNGTLSAPVLAELARLGVRVTVSADKRSVLEEKLGRRFLAMLRLIANRHDHLAWRTRLELTDGIGPTTLGAIYEFARMHGTNFSIATERIPEFLNSIPAPSRGVLRKQIDDTRLTAERFTQVLSDQDRADTGEASEELKALVQAVAKVEITEEEGRAAVLDYVDKVIESSGAKTLEDLLVSIAIGREEMDVETDQDSVNLLSMHQAKGLTAEVVFVMAAEDEILPREQTANAVDDDRRLLYVSMTRARQKLIITYSGMRTGRQQHSGRNPGTRQRHLTRFLRDSPLRARPGEGFIQANT